MANDNNSSSEPIIQDNQKFTFDAKKSFNENILGIGDRGEIINPMSIDRIRSYINIDDNKEHLDKDISLRAYYNGTIGNSKLSPSETPQESRCHAFYRIIGFPIISKSHGFYNPGHDAVTGEKKITPAMKGNRAADPIDGFFELSAERERSVNTFLKLFSDNTTIGAAVTALSGINIRDFIAPFKDPNALESKFEIKNQGYDIEDDSTVGYNDVKLNQYVNSDSETFSGFSKKRYHFIKPFAVDPRIDISVPVEKKMAVPFTLDPSNRIVSSFSVDTKTTQKAVVNPPLIEAIIIERSIGEGGVVKLGGLDQSTIDAIKSIEGIQDEQLVKDISSGNVYELPRAQQFVYYLNVIRAMVVQLVAALKIIEEIQSDYYWLPIPSITGPENGCSVNKVFAKIFDNNNKLKYLQTEKDKQIVISFARTFAELDPNLTAVTADIANLYKKSYPLFFNKRGSNHLGDRVSEQLKSSEQERNKALTAANEQLKIIELIMGEYSGFGLADMIAIMGGLYLMPVKSLLGFLDEDAYDRAKKAPGLKGKIPDENPATIYVALDDLTKNVISLYNIMDEYMEEIA